MAEPVGFLGTAVGVVSLGLQVYGSLNQYLSDYKTRDEQVNKALAYLERLQQSLEIIESVIPSFRNEHRIPARVVTLSLQAAQDELQALDNELKKYETSTPVDIKGKMKEMKKRFTFPFSKTHLAELESALEQITRNLSMAIDSLELNTLSAISIKTTKIESTLLSIPQSIESSTSQVADRVSTLGTSVQSSHVETIGRLDDIKSSLQTRETAQEMRGQRQEEKLSEILGILLTLQDSSSDNRVLGRQLTGMIVSKPGLFKDIGDAVNYRPTTTLRNSVATVPQCYDHKDTFVPLSPSRHQTLLSCRCRRRRRATREFSNFAPFSSFSTFKETIVESQHELGCPHLQPNTSKYHQRVGVVFTGLHRYLSIAFSISLSLNYGAGGNSISPTFTYFAMVDSTNSPAFRIIRVLKSLSERPHQKVVHYGMVKLRQIFRDGLASPSDVSQGGDTLISFLLKRRKSFWLTRGYIIALHDLLQTLLNLGVPCELPAEASSKSALQFCLNYHISSSLRGVLAEYIGDLLLRESTNDITLKEFNIFHFRDYAAESERVAEAAGLDTPLFRALLHRDADALDHILQGQVKDFPMQTASGLTPVHVAIGWPDGLKMLLNHVPNLDIESKCGGEAAFLLSIRYSRVSCRERESVMCSNCTCAKSVKLLLEAGCYLDPRFVWRAITNGSLRAISVFIGHIKMWRDKLMRLMLHHIPQIELQQPERHGPHVLDAKVHEVVATLEQEGVHPFEIFKLQPDDYRLGDLCDGNRSKSIYHHIDGPGPAQLAFEVGFRDVDEYFKGQPPLMVSAKYPWKHDYAYWAWLIAHGATYTNFMKYDSIWIGDPGHQSQHTFAHIALKGLGGYIGCFLSNTLRKDCINHETHEPQMRLACLLGKVPIRDGCKCGCSAFSDGCYPITMFLNLMYENSRFWPAIPEKDIFVWLCDNIFDHIVNDDPSMVLTKAILQVLTFNFLDIRHTCCTTPAGNLSILRFHEDRAKIWDEDRSIFQKLNELVSEFMDLFSSQASSFPEFLKQYWYPRMEAAKQELKGQFLAQKDQDLKKTRTKGHQEELGHHLRKDSQYFIDKLDEIWPGSVK